MKEEERMEPTKLHRESGLTLDEFATAFGRKTTSTKVVTDRNERIASVTTVFAVAGCAERPQDMRRPVAIDGDTFVDAAGERYRLARIDTPEMGRCREGRKCVEGDPIMAKRVLAMVVERRGEAIRCRKIEKDRYGRWIAECHT